ncbi:MAG TPA: N-acetyltransferase [Terriglobales bacterium]|nr:N-acetyltransferase [Terriglobales bacterium]
MGFVLRDFRQEDFEALWQIDQQCFVAGMAYSRAELAAYIRRETSFTVVAQPVPAERATPREPQAGSSPIVGFIIAEVNRRGIGHIISIDVLPACRRSGLGSQLLREAEHRLERVRCRAVMLETAVDNSTALAFYKRHQYGVVKVIPRYYLNGVDALILEKRLDPEEDARREQEKG